MSLTLHCSEVDIYVLNPKPSMQGNSYREDCKQTANVNEKTKSFKFQEDLVPMRTGTLARVLIVIANITMLSNLPMQHAQVGGNGGV